MELTEARYLAEMAVSKLKPACERIIICGSIRRQAKNCSDIDLVLLPNRRPIKDLFGMITKYVPTEDFIDRVNSWEKVRGEAIGKYTQRIIEGKKLEISIADYDNFGALTLIRTGNSDFTHMIMNRVLKCGLEQRDGYLWNDTKKIPIHSEEEYFRILDLPYIAPPMRDKAAFKKARV